MHQKNSNHVGYHHIEGFQDCFIFKEDRYAKTIDTRDESPCITISFQVHCFYGNDPQNTDLSRFYNGPVDYTHSGPNLYQGLLIHI